MLCRWPDVIIYAFPPVCLLPQVVRKLRTLQRMRVLLVAPWSPNAKLFPSLIAIPNCKVVEIPVSEKMLKQPHWDKRHPDPEKLTLHLWCLRGSD